MSERGQTECKIRIFSEFPKGRKSVSHLQCGGPEEVRQTVAVWDALR